MPVALITAASRGIGAAAARELAGRGYDLALLARSADVEVVAAAVGGIAVRGSVTDPADLARLVTAAMDAHGRVDVVVNNTGHPPKGELLEISDADWHLGMDVVLLNVVRLARLVTPIMQAQGAGAIVNVSTFAAYEPRPTFPVSAALRAALGSFAKLYADRYAADGIRMNNVLPGFVESYPVDDATQAEIPLGRPATTKEIAQTIVFLASDDSSYITGQNLRVDGGITRGV